MFHYLGRLLVACITVAVLLASEHHGIVKSNGMPVPGATVTAVKGDKKVATTTDDNGEYTFPDLEDGVWTITVDMLGFGKQTKEVAVTAQAPSPEWDIKLLSAAEMKSAIAAAAAPPAAATTTAAKAAPAAAANSASTPAKPGTPESKPAATTAANNNGRQQGGNAGGRGGNNGRPSLRSALQQGGGTGFQRADVNATGDGAGAANNDNSGDLGMNNNAGGSDLSQNSGDALAINGSVSSGLGMPQQNDWFGGRGMGMGMGMEGMGGPMGMGGPGMGGPGADGGGGGGPVGRGGGPGGRGGGPGGGFGGRGGGGFGGRGGRGGPGGRGGRGNLASFGNSRRNPRMRYNGNIGLFLDNSALDAQNYSITGQQTQKPAYAKSRGSAMFGGPLKIPHLLSGEHTTFTINYQMARNRNASIFDGTMPTAAERAGDFTGVTNNLGQAVTIIDPESGSPFPGNVIPQNRFSSQALGLLQYYPLPNFYSATSRYNYQQGLTSVNNQDNVNARISETINWRNQISGGVGYQRANGVSNSVFGFQDTNGQNAVNANLNYSYHFTQRVINRLGYNFSRNTAHSSGYFSNRQNLSGELGINGNDQDPSFWGPPALSFQSSGFSGLNDASKTLNRAQTSALSDSVMWIHGTHNMTFGGDFRRLQNNPLSEQNPRGTFMFNGGISGFDFSDFLLGLPDTSSIAFGNADKYYRNSWFDLYANDDWRINTKLSLNFGLYWSYQAPVTELYGRLVNMDVGPYWTNPIPVCATVSPNCTQASSVGLPNSLIHGDPHEFQPRIGFAYNPFKAGKTVFRGGYGIYYNTSVWQAFANSMAQQYPLSYTVQDSAAYGLLTLANGFPLQSISAISNFALDPHFHLGYSQIWQLSIQQSLRGGMVATVTYNGTKGTHQTQSFIPWSTPPGATAAPYPSNYTYETSGGNSIYQGVSGQLQRRFRSGLMWNAVYTFARSRDDAGTGGRGASGITAQNWLDLDAEWARSSGIRTHTLNFNMQYSTGVGTRGGTLLNGWKGRLIKDWTFIAGINLGSGAPVTPTVQGLRLGGTAITGPVRPLYTGQPLYLPDGSYNPLAFVAPPSGEWGNTGRNVLTGPMLFGTSASAGRIFRLGERRSVDLRFDSQNPLNHVTYTGYNAVVNNLQWGLPTGASAMRSFNANLRFRF